MTGSLGAFSVVSVSVLFPQMGLTWRLYLEVTPLSSVPITLSSL